MRKWVRKNTGFIHGIPYTRLYWSILSDFRDFGLRLSRLSRDYAATMTGSHRRRIRREPDTFFRGKSGRKSPRNGVKERMFDFWRRGEGKTGSKRTPRRTAHKGHYKALTGTAIIGTAGQMKTPPERLKMACIGAKEKRPFRACSGGGHGGRRCTRAKEKPPRLERLLSVGTLDDLHKYHQQESEDQKQGHALTSHHANVNRRAVVVLVYWAAISGRSRFNAVVSTRELVTAL